MDTRDKIDPDAPSDLARIYARTSKARAQEVQRGLDAAFDAMTDALNAPQADAPLKPAGLLEQARAGIVSRLRRR